MVGTWNLRLNVLVLDGTHDDLTLSLHRGVVELLTTPGTVLMLCLRQCEAEFMSKQGLGMPIYR